MKPRRNRFRTSSALHLTPGRGLCSVSALVLFVAGHAQSATSTWDGSGVDGNWNTASNWTSNTAPLASNALIFAGTANLATSNNYAALTNFASIAFDVGAGSFTLGGNAVRLTGNVQDNSTSVQTINLNLRLAGSSQQINAVTGGTLNIAGIIYQGSSSRRVVINGTSGNTGLVTFSGLNTYTGSTTISGGILSVGTIGNGGVAGNLGKASNSAANIVLNGGTLRYTGATSSTNRNFTVGVNGGTLDASGTGALTISGAPTMSGTNTARTLTLTGGNSGNNTLSGIIGNNGTGLTAITKSGAGTWVLSGANTYTGVTTLSAGILSVATIGNGTVTGNLGKASSAASNLVFNGGTLQYTGVTASTDRNFTINAGTVATIDVTTNNLSISGASTASTGGLTKSGAGTLTLTGANLYTGTTTISGGKLALSGSGNISDSSALSLSNTGAAFDISGITGSVKTVASLGGVSGSSVILGTRNLTSGANDSNTTYAGVISGIGGSLTKAGTGTLTLTGANTYTGGTTISAGAVSVGASSALGLESNVLTIASGATLKATGSFNTSRSTTLGGSSGTGGTFEVAGGMTLDYTSSSVISGTGSLTKTGAGTLKLSGVNTYSGGTTITAGTISIANSSALGSESHGLTIGAGATLMANESFSTSRAITLGGADSTIEVAGGMTLSSSSTITGSGSLRKTGTGTLNLSGSNNFSGGTSIENGMLQVNGSSAIGTGAITVKNGGILSGPATPGSSATIAGATVIQSGGELMTVSGGTLSFSSLTLNGGAASTFRLGAQTPNQLIDISSSGGLVLAGSSTIEIINAGAMGVGTYHLFDYSGSAISNFSNLSLASSHTGLYNLTLVNNASNTSIDLEVGAIANQWKKSGTDTLWSSTGNWVTGAVPSGAGADALFIDNGGNGGFGAAETVTVDSSRTVGSLTFSNTTTQFTITASNGAALTLQETSGNALIEVLAAPGSANHVISAPLILGSDLTVDIATGASDLDISGAISGTGKTLNKTGAGPLTLSGNQANTYDGLTKVTGGTLNLGKTAGVDAIGSGGLQIDSGATAVLLASNQISDSATLTVNGSFALGSFSEKVAILGGGGSITTSSGSVLTIGGSENSEFTGVIGGTGGIQKSGSGTLTLGGTNTYEGGTSITGGILSIGADANLGNATGGIAFDGGTLFFSGDVTTTRNVVLGSGGGTLDTDGSQATLSGLISGNGSLTKMGAGTVLLSGSNTYNGETVINDGILRVSGSSSLGSGDSGTTINGPTAEIELEGTGLVVAESLTLNGGVLCNLANTNTYSGAITLGADSELEADGGKLIISSGISGSFGITIAGPGSVELTGTNTYTGATHVENGKLILSSASALPGTAAVVLHDMAGSILELNTDATIGALSGGSTTGGDVYLGTHTLTVGDATSTSFGGVISGTGGALTKQGGGTLTLTGANSYTGLTTVQAGVLNVQNDTALGTSAGGVSVTTGAALQIQGGITIGAEALTLNGNGISGDGALRNISGTNEWQGTVTLASASRINSDADSLTFTASNSITGSSNLTLGGDGDGTVNGTITIGSGALTKDGGGTWTLTGANTFSGGTTVSAGTLILNNSTNSSAVGTGPLTVAAGAMLTGSGSVGGATTISGTHNAGSPDTNGGVGTQAFTSSLAYANNSIFEWDINDNSNTIVFDTVSAVGNITVGTGSVFKVIFGEGVDMTTSFWTGTQTWLMTDIFGESFTSGSFQTVQTNTSVSNYGSFSISGSNLTWNYSAVPETTTALAGLLLAAGLLRRNRSVTA